MGGSELKKSPKTLDSCLKSDSVNVSPVYSGCIWFR